jgi:dipeptidyl aminopeptidase/acylaminoacyl peptidase
MPIPLIPRAHLFGNPTKAQARISPDSTLLSWIAPLDGVLNLWVSPVDTPADAWPITQDRKRGIRNHLWTYHDHHLVYAQDEEGNENFHLYAVDPHSRETQDLTPFEGVTAVIRRRSREVRDRLLIGLNQRDRRFHDLYTVDIAAGALELVEENHGFSDFVCDELLRPHLAVRDMPDGSRAILRHVEGDWAEWITFAPEDARVSAPNHLDALAQTAFFRDSRGRDTAALTRVDLETGETALIAAHDEADIGSVLADLDTREPIAYSVMAERLTHYALDPALEADFDFLKTQDIGDWSISARTEDDNIWILGTSSDTRPSIDYLYDRGARSVRELHRGRPELDGAPLVRMQPLRIKSRDGLDLVSYLSLPKEAEEGTPQAMVLLVHGGPWARDGFGYSPLHQWLANRGYAVLSVNFRSSTGFGKAFLNAGDHEWGRRMDDDLIDAVNLMVERKIADPKRVAIMGGSYGGYATLVGLTRNPDLYACGVDIVGPSNLETLVRTVPPYWETFRVLLHRAIGDPDTPEGLSLARERSPLFRADRITKPLLIAQGANDPRVKQAESDQMVEALKSKGIKVAYLLYPDEGHGFARPQNNIAFYAIAETFLARRLGGRFEPVHSDELAASSVKIVEGAEELSLPDGTRA